MSKKILYSNNLTPLLHPIKNTKAKKPNTICFCSKLKKGEMIAMQKMTMK
jgi:hypothetical protein